MKAKFSKSMIDAQDYNDLLNQAKQMKSTGNYTHRLDSHSAGTLPTKKMGSGMDYAESRPYQIGDDPRFINWRLTARSNDTLVKNFHAESSPTLCVLMDRGATMRFGTRKRLKVTQAMRVATMLSLVSQQHRLALSGMILDENENGNQWFPSSQNGQAFNSWIDAVTDFCSPLFTNEVSSKTSNNSINQPKDWRLILQNLADKNPTGSLIYLVSDFAGLTKEHQSTLEALQAQHHVIALHISDSAEQSLSNNGTLRVKNSQSNTLHLVESGSDKQRAKFQSRALAYQESIKKIFEERGIPFISISTIDDDLATIIPLPLEAM